GPLVYVLSDHELLLHAGVLGDHRFLVPFLHLDGALLEGIAAHRTGARSTGCRAPLHVHGLLPQSHLLLHRMLDDPGLTADAAVTDLPLADMQFLLGNRDDLLTPTSVAHAAPGAGHVR